MLNFEDLKGLIGKNKIKEVLDFLKNQSEKKSLNFRFNKKAKNDLILITARFQAFLEKETLGLILAQEAKAERSLITYQLLELIDRLEHKKESTDSLIPKGRNKKSRLGASFLVLVIIPILAFFIYPQIKPAHFSKLEEDSCEDFVVSYSTAITDSQNLRNVNIANNDSRNHHKMDAPIVKTIIVDNQLYWEEKKDKLISTYNGEDVSNKGRVLKGDYGTFFYFNENSSIYKISNSQLSESSGLKKAISVNINPDTEIPLIVNQELRFFLNGQDITSEFKIIKQDNLYMAYKQQSGLSYIFDLNKKDNFSGLMKGELIGNSPDEIVWANIDNQYIIFQRGEKLTLNQNLDNIFWPKNSNERLIFNPKNGYTYLLTDYKNNNDSKFRNGSLLSKNENEYIWRKASSTSYTCIQKGESVNIKNRKWKFEGDDYIITLKNKKLLAFKDYKNIKDSTWRIALPV